MAVVPGLTSLAKQAGNYGYVKVTVQDVVA